MCFIQCTWYHLETSIFLKKNYRSPAIHEHSSYTHDFLVCTIGPREQIFHSIGCTITSSELVSLCSNWYFLYFVFYSWFHFYWYCFSGTRLLNIPTLILKWHCKTKRKFFTVHQRKLSHLIPDSTAMTQNAKKIVWRIELPKDRIFPLSDTGPYINSTEI